MSHPTVDEAVTLAVDIPELSLRHGARGTVRGIWLAPAEAYEVEFSDGASAFTLRVLLRPEQIEPNTHT